MNKGKLTPHDERRVAVHACVDPRTVGRFLAGRPTRSTVASRIRDTLVALGFASDASLSPELLNVELYGSDEERADTWKRTLALHRKEAEEKR